jgi:hypothetical protein
MGRRVCLLDAKYPLYSRDASTRPAGTVQYTTPHTSPVAGAPATSPLVELLEADRARDQCIWDSAPQYY